MAANYMTLKFSPKWILQNQAFGGAKIAKESLASILKRFNIEKYVVIKIQFDRVDLLFISDNPPQQKDVLELIKSKFSNIDDKAGVKVDIKDISGDGIKKLISDFDLLLNQEKIDTLKKEFNVDISVETGNPPDETQNGQQEKSAPGETKPDDENRIDVDSLIGLKPLKQWVSEISSLKGRYFDFAKQTGIIDNTAFLFSIDSGNGLTRIIDVMVQTLEQIGYGDFGGGKNIIEYRIRYSESTKPFDSYYELIDMIRKTCMDVTDKNSSKKMILALSLEEWIDKIHERKIDMLLRKLLSYENIIFIFTIPYVEGVVANRIYDRLNDMFCIRYMRFKPPTIEEYFQCFNNRLNKFGITLEADTYSAFAQKIIEEKNDGRFYGFNTVKKISTEVFNSILIKAAKDGADIPRTISKETLEDIYALEDIGEHSGMEQLNGMIALDEVKKRVLEIVAAAKLQKKLYLQGKNTVRPCLHMMFTGNPGTGKTVVARLIGRIMKEEGILSNGNFFEVTRQDLVGQYVGQTAPKTMDICRSAYGSVLFIDEAYMLANDKESFGSEAIGTLISEMENNRDNMVVILAGYKDEMEKLFDINAGLKERIPHIINFPNYSRSELKDIFFKQLSVRAEYEEGFEEEVNSFFESIPDSVLEDKEFSNGRFVRNLLEKIFSKASLRFDMSEGDVSEFKLSVSDVKSVTKELEYNEMNEKENRTIGF